MARVAKKKTVNNGEAYEFSIKQKDVVERVHFGSFEVVKTKGGIMFKNYTGFHVYTTPYAVGVDGVAHENSLYQWLNNLIEAHKELSDKLDEPFSDELLENGQPLLNRDIYDAQKITTEANCLYPMTAFIDVNHAVEKANEQIQWLAKMSEELAKAMVDKTSLNSDNEDEKIAAEDAAKRQHVEVIKEMTEGVPDAE